MAHQLLEPLRLVERVELRRGDDLHAFGDRRVPELGAGVRLVERQLAADDLEVLDRIAAAERGHVDEVDEHRAALDVAEEAVPQAGAGVRAFDQAGDVGGDEPAIVAEIDDRVRTSVVNG